MFPNSFDVRQFYFGVQSEIKPLNPNLKERRFIDFIKGLIHKHHMSNT